MSAFKIVHALANECKIYEGVSFNWFCQELWKQIAEIKTTAT